MERREFLKLTLGFTAAAGAIAAAATTAQAAPMLPQTGDMTPPAAPKPAETAMRSEEAKPEMASHEETNTDTDMSSRRWWRRRRRYWRRRWHRRRWWRRRRRVIYY